MSDAFDFIADVHGQQNKLTGLLRHLGYEAHGGNGFRHPEGRRVVFLGDYIDRGPKIRETLQTVRAMVDAGEALAIMGNHEFNAIAWDTPSSSCDFLREHSDKNYHQHEATLTQFERHSDEWKDWIAWFKDLPMWLDLGNVRAVHACWDDASLAVLANGDLGDAKYLEACALKGTREYDAVETVLKGPEVPLPNGLTFTDKQGIARRYVRSRWWHLTAHDQALTFGDLAMPPGSFHCDVEMPEAHVERLPNYKSQVPVFFGHYWLPPTFPKSQLAPNICCLDFSAGLGGPLMGYRWDGEDRLTAERIIGLHSEALISH